MRVKILNHREVGKRTKEVSVANIYDQTESKLVLTDKSYTNFVRYCMHLWNNDQRSVDVVTKIVKNKDCYCFYKV